MSVKARGKALVYPERKRCLTCRGFFGFTILAGLWCSYECAGHPEPSRDPRDWPRGHRLHWSLRRAKRVFDSEAEARACQGTRGKTPYLCDYCLTWHVGSWTPNSRAGKVMAEGEVTRP